jgi:hypothetical protein
MSNTERKKKERKTEETKKDRHRHMERKKANNLLET